MKSLHEEISRYYEAKQLLLSQIIIREDMFTHANTTSRNVKTSQQNNSHLSNIYRYKVMTHQKNHRNSSIKHEKYVSANTKKSTEQKIAQINNFVKKLTDKSNQTSDIPQMTETKFKALKKIIQYYDIKNLDKSQYASTFSMYLDVIKSFGLQIQPAKTERKNHSSTENKKHFNISYLHANGIRTNRPLKKKEISEDIEKKFIMKNEEDFFSIKQQSKQKLIALQKIKEDIRCISERKEKGFHLFNSVQLRKSKIKQKCGKKTFKFSNSDNTIKDKINKYRQFLFILNYSNRIYRNLQLDKYSQSLRYYVGKGNNSNLIRSLMKKRFWFQQTTNQRIANFIWSQIKIPYVFIKQPQLTNQQCEPKFVDKKILLKNTNMIKNDSLQRILYNEEFKQLCILQDNFKNKPNINQFQEKIKNSPRKLKNQQISSSDLIHNHFPGNGLLGNKKAMFYALRQYYNLINENVFEVVPFTFIINQGLLDAEYNRFVGYFNQKRQMKRPNYWILKPGQFSNRGNGIQCTNKLQIIRNRVSSLKKNGKIKGSLIIQEYICRPLLYNNRKFDIRVYMLLTFHNGKTKAYWYQDGYIRTSCCIFSLEQISDNFIHLTNDAVQKHAESYGKYEEGNKLSFGQFQRYLDSISLVGKHLDFHSTIIPQMKNIAANSIKSSFIELNKERKDKNFELFGLDFMIDESFKPWLIEINTNPCLQLSSPVLQRLIPYMIENALRICLDPIFPPPENFSNNFKYTIPQNSLHYNKFELIFDSDREGKKLIDLYKQTTIFKDLAGLQQDKNEFLQDGEMIIIDDL